MSLINDALKRAKQAQQKSPPPPSSGPVLRPVEPVRRKQSNLGSLLPLALVVLVGVGGIITWFAMRPGSTKTSPSSVASAAAATKPLAPRSTATTSTPKVASALTAHPPAPSPVIQMPPKSTTPLPIPVVAISEPNPATNPVPVASATTTPPPVVIASEPPPPPPLPKLHGIFYRPERPAVLLNGKTVLVGGTSGDYRVVAISQQSVTVVRAGVTNVLSLAE